ncbi:SDR family oxidoreductase, partial [Pseudactinotalea sp.]|uniref:SDR family oxidoreductase n=1 Tax=Pseudactinotalea sp. TaxID=1926260 RepID=UPI003B3A523A
VDLIVDAAALVNHVLPYSQLFGPNALGTAELIQVAVTTKLKPIVYVSTIGVGQGIAPGDFNEHNDIRRISPTRVISDAYANGYSTSKWAGEVLLREAHDVCRVPVSVFRCDMILADLSYAGQLNVPDMFTRMMLSLVASGVAPKSFYELDADGNRQRSHYGGLPVEFVAEAISTLGLQVATASDPAFDTYHVVNTHDDGIGLDEYVDWLVTEGYPIGRVDDYAEWLTRLTIKLRALPERQRNASLLPLLHNYERPTPPMTGAEASTSRFRTAVQDAAIGPDHDIPHVTRGVITKYVTDLELLALLSPLQRKATAKSNSTTAEVNG